MKFSSMLKKLAAFLPVEMSLTALATVGAGALVYHLGVRARRG